MRALNFEWVEKAESDYSTALRESHARKGPNFDAACFHCHQCATCVEKYLKTLLQERERYFSFTHKFIALLESCISDYPEIELYRDSLNMLDRYAVTFRYLGENAIKPDVRSAM